METNHKRFLFHKTVSELLSETNAGDDRIVVTVLLVAIYSGMDRSHVPAAQDMVNTIVEPVLVEGDSGAVAGLGVGISHETAEHAVRI